MFYTNKEKEQKRSIMVNIYDQHKMLLPSLPYNDDFIRIMNCVFKQSKWFGVPTRGKVFSGIWSIGIIAGLLTTVIGAIWKIIKALGGWASDYSGGRSVVARFSGCIFYSNSFVSLLLIRRVSEAWNDLALYWAMAERTACLQLPTETNMKRNLAAVVVFISICACGEHVMSIASSLVTAPAHAPISLYFKLYILNTHGFLILNSDYSLWIAIPIFFVSKIATVLWNLQDLLIILFSFGLTSRYKRLNAYVRGYAKRESGKNNFQQLENEKFIQTQNWRRIREAFVRQAALVRKVNQELGGLILLSNFSNFYFICLQLFNGIGAVTPFIINKIYFFVSLFWLIFRSCSVVLSAAEINVQSQKALTFLKCCPHRSYNVEVQRLEKQLCKDFVAFSGMGFYYLDRSLLLVVAAAILTYELVLLDFDRN